MRSLKETQSIFADSEKVIIFVHEVKDVGGNVLKIVNSHINHN